MTFGERLFLALTILLVDILIFAVPLTAFFAVYMLLARPAWFKLWIDRVYGD